MKTLFTAALLGLVAGSGVAYAQTAIPQAPRPMKADANNDGKVSRAEFLKGADTKFTTLDVNKDGSLTRDEARVGRGARHGGFGDLRGRFGRGPARMMQDGPPPPGAGMRGPGGGMARFDTDGDGKVTRAEFNAQSASRFARMDTNSDGTIDKTEMAAMPGGGRMMGGAGGNASGTLTRAEFDAQAKKRFDRIDTNGDGVLDATELQAGPMGRGGRNGPAGAPPAPTPPAPNGA